MTRYLSTILALVFGATMMTVSASAQTGQDTSGRTMANSGKQSADMGDTDSTFVKKAAQGGMAEVELGQLATQKASSEEVKKLGQRMVDDHTKANDQLKKVAAEKNIQLPDGLDAKDKAIKARLEKLSGEQFDKAYMKDMVKDHKKDVAEFQKESQNGKDPAVKNFAQETLPKLQDHLQEAQKIAPMGQTKHTSGE